MGRRERPRSGYARRSFWERYRGPITALAVVAGVVLIGAFVFSSATAKTYVCGTEWQPAPTASPAAGASPRYGYVQPDMGRNHAVSAPQNYVNCPPASGNHWNIGGRGPIEARVYGPDDFAEPAGWIHNLEHGALVILYRGREGDPGLSDAVQDQLQRLRGNFPASPICGIPPGQLTPVIARFDDMAYPYAALVWGRVLPLQTLDEELIKQFWLTEGERTNPEAQCAPPSPSPGPSASPGASGSVAPSPAGSAAPSGSAPAAPSGSPAASPAGS